MSRQIERSLECYIGDKIRRRRAELGLTQEELGRGLEISYQQIQKYESGANRISASRLLTLARRLGVEVGWFFDGFETSLHPAVHGNGQRAAIELARAFNDIGSIEARGAVGALVRAVVERQAPPA